MFGKRPTTMIVGAILLGLTGQAMADSTVSENQALRAQVNQLQVEMAEMKQAQSDNWLNERRAEEVKSLIREVLSDADTRASLLQDGILAGNENGKFFLKSADGNFKMNVGAHIQFRYLFNTQDSKTDEDEEGFQLRRGKLKFKGHAFDPALGYKLVLTTERSTGDVYMQDAIISYQISDDLKVSAGVQKLPFLRGELTSSSKLLAVERSLVNEFFTLDRTEQIQVNYQPQDNVKLAGAISDGARGDTRGYTDFGADTTEFAFTGRADVLVEGDWSALKDYTSFKGEDRSILVGGAVHYEVGDANNGGTADYFAYTLDGSFEQNGLSIAGAFMGGHVDFDGSGANSDVHGVQLQGAYMVTEKLQPFARYEWIDSDSSGRDDIHALTFGANYYVHKHNVKFTADVVWIFDGDVFTASTVNPFTANPFSSGLGLAGAAGDFSDDALIALRAQVQLAF